MEDAAEELELTALEQMEFNRRNDSAFAIIPFAIRLFTEREELSGRLKSESKQSWNYWHWALFAGALALNYFLSDDGSKFTWAAWVAIMVAVSWFEKQYVIWKLGQDHDRCNRKLFELEVAWNAATSQRTFWDISRFAGELGFDPEDDAFSDWWGEQRLGIFERVCGWDRGRRIGKDRAERHAKFRQELREMRSSE
jgi:hypothetical protein